MKPLTDEERRAIRKRLRAFIDQDGSHDLADFVCDFAASEVERERESIVEWIRGGEARMKKQREAGAVSLHHMHTAGQLDACAAIANAIEKGDHR